MQSGPWRGRLRFRGGLAFRHEVGGGGEGGEGATEDDEEEEGIADPTTEVSPTDDD